MCFNSKSIPQIRRSLSRILSKSSSRIIGLPLFSRIKRGFRSKFRDHLSLLLFPSTESRAIFSRSDRCAARANLTVCHKSGSKPSNSGCDATNEDGIALNRTLAFNASHVYVTKGTDPIPRPRRKEIKHGGRSVPFDFHGRFCFLPVDFLSLNLCSSKTFPRTRRVSNA